MTNIFSKWMGSSNNAGPVQLETSQTLNNNASHLSNPNNSITGFFKSFNLKLPKNALELPDLEANNIVNNIDEGSLFRLSYFERISLFVVCLIGTYFCYSICFILFPFFLVHPRKFATVWTLGSILFLSSFMVLNGFYTFWKHALSKNRLPFTLYFTASIIATPAFALIWHSTLAIIICSLLQIFATIVYTVSHLPWGRAGLTAGSTIARTHVQGWLNT